MILISVRLLQQSNQSTSSIVLHGKEISGLFISEGREKRQWTTIKRRKPNTATVKKRKPKEYWQSLFGIHLPIYFLKTNISKVGEEFHFYL